MITPGGQFVNYGLSFVRATPYRCTGKLTSQKSCEVMTTPKAELNSPQYGYGFAIDTAQSVVGHNGGFPGISSNLDMFKGTGYTAVVLSNYGGASRAVVEKIRALVRSRAAATSP